MDIGSVFVLSICNFFFFFFFTSSVYIIWCSKFHIRLLWYYTANVPLQSLRSRWILKNPFLSLAIVLRKWILSGRLGCLLMAALIRSQTHSAAHCSGVQAVEEQDQQGRVAGGKRKTKEGPRDRFPSVWELHLSERLPPPPHSFPKPAYSWRESRLHKLDRNPNT